MSSDVISEYILFTTSPLLPGKHHGTLFLASKKLLEPHYTGSQVK